MGKRRRILLAVALVAILGGLTWFALAPHEPPEPVFQGKPLSTWLAGYERGQAITLTEQLWNADAEAAIHHIGTNAIPTLLRMLRAQDSGLKFKLITLLQKQHVVKINYVPANIQNKRASSGFALLGTSGSNAVPALVEMLDQSDPGSFQQYYVIYCLACIGPAANNAVPALVRVATDATNICSVEAILALCNIHSRAELAVPVLINCLNRTNDINVQLYALEALAKFGREADQAVPALIKILKDPKSEIREEVRMALKRIDPEAVAKEGIK